MKKIDISHKQEIYGSKGFAWNKVAMGAIATSIVVGLATNALNIANSAKQKPFIETFSQKVNAKLYNNVSLDFKYF